MVVGLTPEARKRINNQELYVMPTLACNRKPVGKDAQCPICIAAPLMADAEKYGYESPKADFAEVVAEASQLPWKRVTINGGEPLNNLNSLKPTLGAIRPDRPTRVISNGDALLAEPKKTETLQALTELNQGRPHPVSLEISGHDSLPVFQRKILTAREQVPVGAQIRREEGREFKQKIEFLERENVPYEVHSVLGIGNSAGKKDQRHVPIELKKLIAGTGKDGVYVRPGRNGTQVIANPEAPYLVGTTPADIAQTYDSSSDVLSRMINHFNHPNNFSNRPTCLDDQVIGYAKAALETGVPLKLDDYLRNQSPQAIEQARKLMEAYREVLAEKNGLTPNEVSAMLARNLAHNIRHDLNCHGSLEVANPLTQPIAVAFGEQAVTDQNRIGELFSKKLLGNRPYSYTGKDVYDNPGQVLLPHFQQMSDPQRKAFLKQLEILGLTENDIESAAQLLRNRDRSPKNIIEIKEPAILRPAGVKPSQIKVLDDFGPTEPKIVGLSEDQSTYTIYLPTRQVYVFAELLREKLAPHVSPEKPPSITLFSNRNVHPGQTAVEISGLDQYTLNRLSALNDKLIEESRPKGKSVEQIVSEVKSESAAIVPVIPITQPTTRSDQTSLKTQPTTATVLTKSGLNFFTY